MIDGDTLKCGKDSIRLVGFDAPEIFSFKCADEYLLGEKARERLQSLAADPNWRLDILPKRDVYGRLLGRAYVGKTEVAKIMIQEGLARTYSGKVRRQGWCRN